jgi:hypothetical protein
MIPVLGKVGAIFAYERDETGKPTGRCTPELAFTPSENIRVTAKMDGTCCLIKDGQVFGRQDVRRDITKAPADWFPTNGTEPDRGGHIIGFRPVLKSNGTLNDGSYKWHKDALDLQDPTRALFLEWDPTLQKYRYVTRSLSDFNGMTAELVGPKVNGNRHKLDRHAYIIHGSTEVDVNWKDFEALKEWLDSDDGKYYEGIVIHDLGSQRLYKAHRGHLGMIASKNIVDWKGEVLPIVPGV